MKEKTISNSFSPTDISFFVYWFTISLSFPYPCIHIYCHENSMDTCGSFNSHVMTFSGSQCLEQESWRCYLGLTGHSGDSDWGHRAPKANKEDLLHVYSGNGCNEPLLCHRLLVRGRHWQLRPHYPPRVSPNMPAASSEQVRVKGSHQEGKISPHVTSSGEAPLTLCPVSHESRELHKVVVPIHPWPSTSHDTASAHSFTQHHQNQALPWLFQALQAGLLWVHDVSLTFPLWCLLQ